MEAPTDAPPATVEPTVAPRYMARFACIGSACEDNCCHDWHVEVDHPQLVQLRARLSDEESARAFTLLEGEDRAGGRYARINQRPDATCVFLDEQQLCTIHGRFGPSLLSSVCASYPRTWGRVGGTLELAGMTSCPEVCRQLLLVDDAMVVEPLLDAGPPGSVYRQLEAPDPGRPWEARFVEVRQAIDRLLVTRTAPVAARLLAVAYLGESTRGFYHLDGHRVGSALLDEPLREAGTPEALEVLAEELAARAAPDPLIQQVVVDFLVARSRGSKNDRVRVLADALGLEPLDPAAVWQAHALRKQALRPSLVARMERWFENFVRNHYFRDWYTGWRDLQQHAQILLVRVAALRLVLLAQPALVDAGDDTAAQDRVAVEVFYRMARAFEHNRAYTVELVKSLERAQLMTLATSAALLLY